MTIPLSLYIHIPWCVQKCPYCDFNSHAVKNVLPEADYVAKVLMDLKKDIQRFDEQRPLHSIFIGGGTPSLFSGAAMARLLDGVREQLALSPGIEITLEANPGTVDERHFADYYKAGVNRLSIGIQSFSELQLQRLGRIHNPEESVRAVKTAQDVGFERINIDLMFGLPHQTEYEAFDDIERGLALGTSHMSYYQLTLEPNTAFAHTPPQLPADELIDQRFERASQYLRTAGFSRYEVSAWSQGDSQRSLHNLNYWRHGDYLGIGAGAHGKMTIADGDVQQIIRTTKPRSPKFYLSQEQVRHERMVLEKDKAFEFMLNAMRLMDGFDIAWIEERGVISRDTIMPTLYRLQERGLLIVDDTTVTPTDLGKRFVNDMVEQFLA